MVSYPPLDVVDIVIDEIALEGLDGITLEALWQRLSRRFQDPLPLANAFVKQVWTICLQVKGIDFYQLKTPRDKLVIFDRYELIDPDLGTILEPDDVPDDIYPHCPIEDTTAGIKGSCSSYWTRRNISSSVKEMSIEQASEKYGQTLVLVASQWLREQALVGDNVCPLLELTSIQYCFLERVGRARYHGEVTQGKNSLSLLKEDPKSLFYHRKFLLCHKLITKQIHHQKTAGHSTSGSLLHLPRFYVERKPKVIYLAEQVIEILKSKVNCVAEYDEIRKELQIENSIKKLFRTAFFQKVVKTDLRVPYRTMYPRAGEKEWQQKNNPTKEKTIRVVQLLDPEIDVSELWGKDEINDDDETFELDISRIKYNVPLLKQANRVVEQSGREGVCQSELAKKMGQTKLQARTILRNLVKLKIVATYMNDVGRQRVTKFVSKKFEKSSVMSKQYEQEMDKIKELTKDIDDKIASSQPSQAVEISNLKSNDGCVENSLENSLSNSAENSQASAAVQEKSDVVDVSCSNEATPPAAVSEESVDFEQSTKNLRVKFSSVNRIISKYKCTKLCKRYRRTYPNISKPNNSDGTASSLPDGQPVPDENDAIDEVETVDQIRTTEQILEEQSLVIPNLKCVDRSQAITLYDSIETKLVEQLPQRLGKPSNKVIGFIEDLHINEKKDVSSITYRLLKRANMIIESVKEHKVIDDLTKLMKMINEEEDREGYDVKIDKKSVIRLLQRLAKDNIVKNIKLTLRSGEKEKTLTFICDPIIGLDHTVIQSAVEQAKIKFCLMGAQKMKAIMQNQQDEVQNKERAPRTRNAKGLEAFNPSYKSKNISHDLQYDFKVGKRYGYSPKFIRMKTLHAFLFYIIYDHPGDQTESNETLIAKLRESGHCIDNDLAKEMSQIYNLDVGWKMFVPPITRHRGWPLGWTIMCDFLLRIPLSIFIKIHNVSFVVPGIESWLNHPIRKHFLVKNLPPQIRNILLIARKYIYNIHETVTRLCYIGLIQFGPQKLKEKDQVFIYLNRCTQLTDTTSSAAGYHKVEKKEYPKTIYVFESLQVVEKYWYDMWNTCINTSLGGRLAVEGKYIVVEDLPKKSEMIQAVKARTAKEAALLDNGMVPGDGCGAAGVDSAFFAHLKRNWNWGSSYTDATHYTKDIERRRIEQQRNAYLSNIKANPLKFTEFSGLKKVTGPATAHAVELRKKLHQRQKTSEERKAKHQKYQKLVSHHVSRQKSFVRRVMPRKRKLRPRVKYDEVDFCALQQMEKLRVDWEPHEDNILLMCKVAMKYLCPNPRKQLITFTTVRDILRSYSSTSHNKTSRACQRRLMYMCRKPQTMNSVALGVEEIKQNYYINQRFGDIVDKLKKKSQNIYEYEEEVARVFRELVTYIDKRYYNITEMKSRDQCIVPKTIQEFNLLYRIKHPGREANAYGLSKEIKNSNDIHAATIHSVIHSSMCCGKDRTAWAYQLFRVYQQYPESLLKSAMNKIRSDGMVSMKKSYMCALKKYGNCMPMSSSQYQLSSVYIYKFQTKWPYGMFNEAYRVFEKFARWYRDNQLEELNFAIPDDADGMEATPVTGGLVVAIHDYLTRHQIDFDIEIPDQIISLNPRLKESDETYSRIAQRYQDILTSLDQLNIKRKQTVGTNLIDPEIEEEDELERREFEDKIVKEKREKEDRDHENYWKSRNDETGRRLEEAEIKLQRQTEDGERQEKRKNFDSQMIDKKKKYAQVLELGEENVPEAIVKEFQNTQDDKTDSDSDQEETDIADDDDENHTIRFQDGTTIVLSREDIHDSAYTTDDEEPSGESSKRNISSPSTRCARKRAAASLDEVSAAKKMKTSKPQNTEIIPGDCVNEESNDSKENEQSHGLEETHAESTSSIDCSRIKSDSPPKKRSRSPEKLDSDELVPDVKKHCLTTSDTSDINPQIVKTELKLEKQNIQNLDETLSSTNNQTNEVVPMASRRINGTRINDILRKIAQDNGDEHSGHRTDDSTDMQKRCTRIALLIMREELNDATLTDSPHAHDYFVVNTFKVFCSLKCGDDPKPRQLENFQNFLIPNDIIPLRRNLAKQLIDDIKKFAIFPKDHVSFTELWHTIEDQQQLTIINGVYKFVRDKQEMGATIKQLLTKFHTTPKNVLYKVLCFWTEHRIFLRSGLTTVRYIHQSFKDPWLIHSFKILRLEKEATVPLPTGLVYTPETPPTNAHDVDNTSEAVTNNSIQTLADEVTQVEVSKDENMCEKSISDEETVANAEESSDQIISEPVEDEQINLEPATATDETNDDEKTVASSGWRMHRSRTALLQQKDIQRAAKKLDFNTAEKIKVVIKPWIRIDGVLNRRVLDRMLGAVLAYCINHPSAFLTKVQRRFAPTLQPVHTLELTEMLVKLECLTMKVVKTNKVSLFSKPSKVQLNDTTGLDSEDVIILEPAFDASIKFGMFLGNKAYSIDFLS